MVKRIPGIAVVAAGVMFLLLVVVRSLFPVGSAFEEMIDDFRPILTDESIAQYQADIEALGAVGDEFRTAVVTKLSEQLNMDPPAFMAMLGERFPRVAQGMTALPDMVPQFSGLIGLLDQQQANFSSADQIPTKDLPAQSVPWGFTIIGVVVIAIGVMMLVRGGRAWSIAAVVIGLLVVVGSFVLTLPGKSADADDLNEALEPVYTVQTVEGAKAGIVVLGGMGQQLGAEMLPGLGQMLGMSPDAVGQFLAENFPVMAQAIQVMPESLARFTELAGVFDANLDNYETLRPVKFTPIIWAFIAGGIVILLAGGFALVAPKESAPSTA